MIILPMLVGFTHIIFRHPFFIPYLPSLTKLVQFSSAMHQMAFTSISTMPFAIGQVDEAGLIFLAQVRMWVGVRGRRRC
jgi:SulP family sulfate permease